MSKRGKAKPFLGNPMNKREQIIATGLVNMSLGRFGIPKKKVKNEARLWTGLRIIFNVGPKEGEKFADAVCRIYYFLRSLSKDERDASALKVDRASFHATLDDLLTGSDKAQYIALRTPVTIMPSRRRPTPSVDAKEEFYKSWAWRQLRLEVLLEQGRECKCCGNRPGMLYASGEPVRIVVDHIKPISKHWHLRLERSNLQPLCDECNMGKGNWDETDFRSPEAPDEWLEEPQDDIALTVLAQMNGETVQ